MKNKPLVLAVFLFAAVFLSAQEYQDMSINASVNTRCKINLSANTVSFTRFGPPTGTPILQNEPPVAVVVKTTTRPSERIYARIVVTGDLTDSKTGQTIPAQSISWNASGSGFLSGSLSKANPQEIGRWNRSGTYQGTLTFSFQDDPAYSPGTYILVVTVTVSAF
jgi:hypothetical protein